jgi:hypothetical protein
MTHNSYSHQSSITSHVLSLNWRLERGRVLRARRLVMGEAVSAPKSDRDDVKLLYIDACLITYLVSPVYAPREKKFDTGSLITILVPPWSSSSSMCA